MQYIELCGARGMAESDKERIFCDTQGNAFLLTQLIGSIMENGQPKVLPSSMEEILSYRLSGLSAEGLQVLNLVAMFPDYAPYRVLERVSSRPTLDLLYVCQELCRRSILAEVYDGGNLSLVFTQAEFRDMTYERIAPLSRRILHLNIAQVLSTMQDSGLPNLDTLTAYHYEQGGDDFHAFQFKVRRFKTYVFFNYAMLSGTPRGMETLLSATPEAMKIFLRMEQEFKQIKQRHPEEKSLEEIDLYYSMGCFCIYRGLYREGVDAISHLLENPRIPVATRELAHEQMIFYGIQTYCTDVMCEHIETALDLTKNRDGARYAINRRYNGYRLVLEGRYAEGREELLRALMLLRDAVDDEVELRLQSSYAHDYIGEAYRKQGLYNEAIEEYRAATDTIGEYISSTSRPMFYVNWCMAALMLGDYGAARDALTRSKHATETVKEPSGYFRTLYCACNAIFAFANGQYGTCVDYLKECAELTQMLIVPYDTGVLRLVEAILRRRCDAEGLRIPEIDDHLNESCEHYCALSRHALKGKMGVPEQELLEKLERGDTDIFSGLFQVTQN